MLKHLAASQLTKTMALCVCPLVTAGVVAVKEPHVRRMVHNATAAKKPVPGRKRAALANVSLPPCTPVAPFATLPRVAAALPSAVGLPGDQLGLTPTPVSAPEQYGSPFNPGFYAPGAFIPGPGGTIGGGGGGGGTNPGGPGGGTTPGGPGDGGGGTTPPPPASGVPEPETWVQILGGFALAGGTVRWVRVRRSQAQAAAKSEIA